jgi:hypothetical protein
VTDRKKMEGYCSTGQSPQQAVVPVEEEEEEEEENILYVIHTEVGFTCTLTAQNSWLSVKYCGRRNACKYSHANNSQFWKVFGATQRKFRQI